MIDAGRAWELFGGACLALMGGSALFGARRFAASNAAWQRQRAAELGQPASPEREERARQASVPLYRAAGAALAAAGALALGGAFARWRGAFTPDPDLARVLGGALLAAATAGALGRLRRAWPRGPRFLADDPLARAPGASAADRAADACGWGLLAVWASFGLRLLFR